MNILVVVAHLDDETFGMYGTLEKLSKNNDITVLSLCTGRRNQDRQQRLEVFQNLMKYLNIHYVVKNYLDLELHKENEANISDIIRSVILSIKAEKVYCTSNDLHSEHCIVNRCTKVAIRNTAVKELLEIYIPGSSDITKFISKIIEPINLSNKLEACKQYTSEISTNTLNKIRTFHNFIGAEYNTKSSELFNLVFKVI